MTPTPPTARATAWSHPTLAELASRCALVSAPGSADPTEWSQPVTGVTLDNRTIRPGELFAALPGQRVHGARFAATAAAAGAVAVLTDADGAAQAAASGLPVLVPPDGQDLREVLARVSALVQGEPTTALRTFAVTGTNGKTTTTFLLAHLLTLLGQRAGLVGTVELRIGGRSVPARLTTPESPELQALARAMVAAGDEALVMEVSSHALSLHRVDDIVFDIAGFTHLTPDHLDFHESLESYFAAKAALFTPAHARSAVVLVDQEWGVRLAAEASVPVTTVRTTPVAGDEAGAGADWWVHDITTAQDGTAFTLTGAAGSLRTTLALPGDFNVSNAALALVMVLRAGYPLARLEQVLTAAGGLRAAVPGRMEVVSDRPRCIVDFAHNADALERALATLRTSTTGRLLLVFGATGDRDRAKRPMMGEVAARGADVVVLTDDDPHGEDPAAIRAEVRAGITRVQQAGHPVQVHERAPRAEAIAHALALAGPEDTVLIAGRGHETIQEVAGVDLELDDRVEVRRILHGETS